MNTPSSREADRIALAEAVAAFTGSIEVLPGFPERPTYKQRTSLIDPATKLDRKKPRTQAQKMALEEMMERKRNPCRAWPDTIKNIAARHGISKSQLAKRLSQGMSMEEATRPTNPARNRWRRKQDEVVHEQA